MENEKLIAALRNNYAPDLHVIEDMQNAADALERLTADSAAKDAKIERLKKHVEDLRLDYCDLLADRDRLQAELDAAVEYADLFSKFVDCEDETFLEYEQWRGWRGNEHD